MSTKFKNDDTSGCMLVAGTVKRLWNIKWLAVLIFLVAGLSQVSSMTLEYNTALGIPGTVITLPLYGDVSVNVDWGDGHSDAYVMAGNRTHTYDVDGIYTVTISGDYLEQFGKDGSLHPDASKLVKVVSFGNLGLSSLSGAFYGAMNLTEVPAQIPSSVTNVSGMFRGAVQFNQNIGGWNTQNVTDMSYLFMGASKFNQNIGGWNTANVTNMSYMFTQATEFNQDIGGWTTTKVANMSSMFNSANAFNQDIGDWNTINVTSMSYMFDYASVFNQDIGDWNTANVTSMSNMFDYASAFNQDIGRWNTAKVTTMKNMFTDAPTFDQDISRWSVGKVTTMDQMFMQDVLSVKNYDALLVGWSGQVVMSDVLLNVGGSRYSSVASRAILTGAPKSWTITDGGLALTQTITFDSLSDKTYGDSAFILTATATTSLPVSFSSSDTTVARVSGSTVTIAGAGTARITASQAGNKVYAAAPPVERKLTVNPEPVTSVKYKPSRILTSAGGTYGFTVISSSGRVEFSLTAPGAADFKISIFDNRGRLLLKKSVVTDCDGNSGLISWNHTTKKGLHLATGTYLLQAEGHGLSTGERYSYRMMVGVTK